MKVLMADPRVIELLSEAIGELSADGRCEVVAERIETCFQIMVIR